MVGNEKKVNEFVEIQEDYITLGFQRQILRDKLSKIKREFIEDRSSEYIEEIITYLDNRNDVFGLASADNILEIVLD